MATPRAIKPFLGSGSRLLRDQLAPQSARICTTGTFISAASSCRPTAVPSASICLGCRYGFSLGSQSRLSSSSSSSSNSNSSQQPPPKPPSQSETEKDATSSSRDDPNLDFSSLYPHPSTPDSTPNSTPSSTASSNPSSTPSSSAQPSSKPPPPPPNPDLPSTQNSRRSNLNRSLSAFMDRAQTTLFAASQRLNDLTGYSGIEVLKRQVSGVEASLATAQTTLHQARESYKSAVAERSATQREVTTLLARQKTWTPADFERFTLLYRQDYELEARVADSARALEDAEREAERLGRDLSAGILARYHEEQIWSDKIRRMSTWGTWGLMGVNVLLFLVFQFGAEPWRRHRLVRGFEEKVREALEEERARDRALRVEERESEKAERRVEAETAAAAERASREAFSAAAAAAEGKPAEQPESEPVDNIFTAGRDPAISWREALQDPERWKAFFVDLSSERKIALRMRDVSLIALEGVVAGVAIASTMAVVFIRRA
ncbi:Mdm33 family-domain-containing protein [Whalleya microplaca]|nr:Mdm33 family-domain-containing protein [Whalleya microplaca]